MPETTTETGLDSVTLGEVWRSLGSLQTTLSTVAGDVSEIRTTGAGTAVQLIHLDRRVSDLESANKWLVRTVGGLIVAAVLAGVMLF